MDFAWTDRQLERREAAFHFASTELAARTGEADGEAFDWDGWDRCARFGVQGLLVPAEFGGSGEDLLTTVLVLETLGEGCSRNGLLFSIQAHLWGCAVPLLHFGSVEQKSRFLTRLAQGRSVGALAAAEPGAGSDVYSVSCRAEKRVDGYVLNGRKTFVTNGPSADLYLVLARTGSGSGWGDLTAFLVEKGMTGFRVGRTLRKMGLQEALMSELLFEDCLVPMENRLGAEGSGAAVFSLAMEWERAFILSSAVGAMERLLQRCTRYSRERQQFGQPIGQFQLVSSRLVDIKLRLETSRLLLYRAAWLKSQERSIHLESSLTKLHISESWVQSCLDAMQIFGGYGYLIETELERELRDALGSRYYSGTAEIQRVLIARLLSSS